VYKIFADLNCPFCFVQQTRLESLGLLNKGAIEWHYVEHAPDQISSSNTSEQLAQLQDEYHVICQRAKDVNVKFPGFCVNSRLAILSLISVSIEYPKKASQYRELLYTAYWQNALDISDPQLLSELLHRIGIDTYCYSEKAERIQSESQRQWINNISGQRIPAVLSNKSKVLLGLQHIKNIQEFFQGHDFESTIIDQTCKAFQKKTIALISSNAEFMALKERYTTVNIFNFTSVEELNKRAVAEELSAVVVDITGYPENPDINNLQQLRHLPIFSRDLPIIAIDKTPCTTNEIIAFSFGASDYLSSPVNVRILEVRLKYHIKAYQSQLLLSQYAYIDSLTGLYNKRILNQKLDEEWQRSYRNKTQLSIIVIDIDHFKNYNDQYGHCLGDLCLKRVAKTINKQLCRPADFTARFGGEEFVVVAPSTGSTGIALLAEKIRSAIENAGIPHNDSPTETVVTVSLGTSSTIPHGDIPSIKLFEHADSALYQSKKNGRNQTSVDNLPTPIIHARSAAM